LFWEEIAIYQYELSTVYPYYQVAFGFTWLKTEYAYSQTCNAVYLSDTDDTASVLLKQDDGKVCVLSFTSVELNTYTYSCIDGNFRDGGYSNTAFATNTYSQTATFENNVWTLAYQGQYVGNKDYGSIDHTVIMQVSSTANCN